MCKRVYHRLQCVDKTEIKSQVTHLEGALSQRTETDFRPKATGLRPRPLPSGTQQLAGPECPEVKPSLCSEYQHGKATKVGEKFTFDNLTQFCS